VTWQPSAPRPTAVSFIEANSLTGGDGT
jgi:hypothetical protein